MLLIVFGLCLLHASMYQHVAQRDVALISQYCSARYQWNVAKDSHNYSLFSRVYILFFVYLPFSLLKLEFYYGCSLQHCLLGYNGFTIYSYLVICTYFRFLLVTFVLGHRLSGLFVFKLKFFMHKNITFFVLGNKLKFSFLFYSWQ